VVFQGARADGVGRETLLFDVTQPTADQIGFYDPVTLTIVSSTPGITVRPTGLLQTAEDGSYATFTVALQTAPTSDVTIAVSSTDETEGTVSTAGLVFTPDDWRQPQVVTVTGADDSERDGDQSYAIVLDPSSLDPSYAGLDPVEVTVFNGDNDVPGVTVLGNAWLSTSEEGAQATVAVVLDVAPTSDVVIEVTSSNPAEGMAAPAGLTFTPANWDEPQMVVVTGVDDAVADEAIDYAIQVGPAVSGDTGYDGLDPVEVPATNYDDEWAGFDVTPVSGLVTSEAGWTATFDVALTAIPVSDVTIAISSLDEDEGTVAPAELTFTPDNWDQPQTATVTGVDDDVRDGPVAYVIELTRIAGAGGYAWSDPPDVTVTNRDDDTPGMTVVAPQALVTSEAGDAATFTVALDSVPTAPVTVDVQSSNPAEGTVSVASLVFAADVTALTPQTVTVTGCDDDEPDGRVQYAIELQIQEDPLGDPEYEGLDPVEIAAFNRDDDAPITPYVFQNTVARVSIFGFLFESEVTLIGNSQVDVGFEGYDRGAAQDDDADGLDEVTAELTALELSGSDRFTGPITVRLASQPSFGEVEENAAVAAGVLELPPFAHGTADAFFDVFLEIDTAFGTLTNRQPARLQGTVTKASSGVNDIFCLINGPIPLVNEFGEETAELDTIEFIPNAVLGSIQGQKWQDANANGIHDPGEPGLDGWTVALLANDFGVPGNPVAIQVSQSVDLDEDGTIDPATESGLYRFESVLPGDYYLLEIGQAGWSRTVPGFYPPTPPSELGPGEHWLAGVQAVEGDWETYAVVDFAWDLNADGQTDRQEQVLLSGELGVSVGDAQVSGTGVTMAPAEIVFAEWWGSSDTGWLDILAGAADGAERSSLGGFREQTGNPSLADAFFDVNFTLHLESFQGEALASGEPYTEWTLHNDVPLHISTTLDRFPPDGVLWDTAAGVNLVDEQGHVRGQLTRLRTVYQNVLELGTGPAYEFELDWGQNIEDFDFGNVDLGFPAATGVDYGDAPDLPGYPTLEVNDGANHARDGRTYLGLSVDAEEDGQPAEDADGDDQAGVDDEDGVQFMTPLLLGQDAQIGVRASTDGYLNAWIDFDDDGDWDDPDEQIATDLWLTAGENVLDVAVPELGYGGVATPQTCARFRFTSYDPQGGLSYAGPADDGEVEDYAVAIDQAPIEVFTGAFTMGVAPTNFQGLTDDHGELPVGLNVWSGTSVGAEADHLRQQWFWYRLGSGPELPLDTLPLVAVEFDEATASIGLTYGGDDDPFSAYITYVLSSAGDTEATIDETVEISNHNPDDTLNLQWFEFTDLDLDPAFGDNAARSVGAGHIEQTSAVLSQVDVVVTGDPLPDHWEIAEASELAAKLADGSATSLSNAKTPFGPTDVAQAFQWHLNLAPGESTIITKSKSGQFADVLLPDEPEPDGDFQFEFEVVVIEPRWFDPALAIGYDYEVSDNAVTAIRLPVGLGDNQYELYLPDAQGGFATPPIRLPGGKTYDDFAEPASRFRVLGIEVDAGLDAANAAAFPTELTPAQTGTMTLTMSAIPENVYVDEYGAFYEEDNRGTQPGVIEPGDLVTWQPGAPDEVTGLVFGVTAFDSRSAAEGYLVGRQLASLTAIVEAAPAEIHGHVFADLDGDGVDDAEPRWIGATVELYDFAEVLVATGQTDTNGQYSFEGLGAGAYTIDVVPAGVPVTTLRPVSMSLAAGDVYVAAAGEAGQLPPGQSESVQGDLAIGNQTDYPWQNPVTPLDVNSDGRVVPLDVLLLINDINAHNVRRLPMPASSDPGYGRYLDVNRDFLLSPRDVLMVINYLNSQGPLSGQTGEGEAIPASTGSLVTGAEAGSAGLVLPGSVPELAELVLPQRAAGAQAEDVGTRYAAATSPAAPTVAEPARRSACGPSRPAGIFDPRSLAWATLPEATAPWLDLETSLTAIAADVLRGWQGT
jgi:hypothetical protein